MCVDVAHVVVESPRGRTVKSAPLSPIEEPRTSRRSPSRAMPCSPTEAGQTSSRTTSPALGKRYRPADPPSGREEVAILFLSMCNICVQRVYAQAPPRDPRPKPHSSAVSLCCQMALSAISANLQVSLKSYRCSKTCCSKTSGLPGNLPVPGRAGKRSERLSQLGPEADKLSTGNCPQRRCCLQGHCSHR